VIFYLTAPSYEALERTDVPLFVNHFALFGGRARRLPRALGPWCLDSGGYTQLKKPKNKGEWPFTPEQYVADVRRCVEEVGHLQWAATMDWMTEDVVLAQTGLDVSEHQYRTIDSYLELRRLGGPDMEHLWLPVLQGKCPEDYHAHYEMYLNEGIALEMADWVGVGSVCRLGEEDQIASVFGELNRMGLHRLHAFGLKRTGLTWADVETRPADPAGLRLAELYRAARERGMNYDEVDAQFQLVDTTWEQVPSEVCSMIYSADSNAWSYRARAHANDVRRKRDQAWGPNWMELAGKVYAWSGPYGKGSPVTAGKGVKTSRKAAADAWASRHRGALLGQVDVALVGRVHALAPTQLRDDCAMGRINRTPGFMHESCNAHLDYAIDWREGLRTVLEPMGCWHESPYHRTLPPPAHYAPELRAADVMRALSERGIEPGDSMETIRRKTEAYRRRRGLPPGAQIPLFNPGRLA
jgi:hypothetical protein